MNARFLDDLRNPGPLVTVELRPPRTGLSYEASMDVWIDMYHSIQRLARKGRYVFLTDNAVGTAEEENLSHLTSNLPEGVDPAQLIPFLTCKHALEYCLMYASRAAAEGFEALTVLGGDKFAGPPRCLPHAYQLRREILARTQALTLGGWVNPHRSPVEQMGFLSAADYSATFALSQVVSHHSADRVEALLAEGSRRGIDLPLVFGVFFYRSANQNTLERLRQYFPVPADALAEEFAEGATPEEICARSIRTLRDVGADKIYVSNLGYRGVETKLTEILSLV